MRYFCPDCRKTKIGTDKHRWCDDCGAELRRAPYSNRKRKRARR